MLDACGRGSAPCVILSSALMASQMSGDRGVTDARRDTPPAALIVRCCRDAAASNLVVGAQRQQAPTMTRTRVVRLGAGTPRPLPARFGPSTAIVVDDTPYLFDGFRSGSGPPGGRGVRVLSDSPRLGSRPRSYASAFRIMLWDIHISS